MNPKSFYRIELGYGANEYWTPVYETNDPHKLYGMYKHFLEMNTDEDCHLRCCVLLGGYFRVINV